MQYLGIYQVGFSVVIKGLVTCYRLTLGWSFDNAERKHRMVREEGVEVQAKTTVPITRRIDAC
jgi:hypothetical protein